MARLRISSAVPRTQVWTWGASRGDRNHGCCRSRQASRPARLGPSICCESSPQPPTFARLSHKHAASAKYVSQIERPREGRPHTLHSNAIRRRRHSPRVSLAVNSTNPAINSPYGALLRSSIWRRRAHWSQALHTTQVAPQTIHEPETYLCQPGPQMWGLPALRLENHGPLRPAGHRVCVQRPLFRRTRPSRHQPRRTPPNQNGSQL